MSSCHCHRTCPVPVYPREPHLPFLASGYIYKFHLGSLHILSFYHHHTVSIRSSNQPASLLSITSLSSVRNRPITHLTQSNQLYSPVLSSTINQDASIPKINGLPRLLRPLKDQSCPQVNGATSIHPPCSSIGARQGRLEQAFQERCSDHCLVCLTSRIRLLPSSPEHQLTNHPASCLPLPSSSHGHICPERRSTATCKGGVGEHVASIELDFLCTYTRFGIPPTVRQSSGVAGLGPSAHGGSFGYISIDGCICLDTI